MGFGKGKGFSPVIPDVEPPEPGYGTNDCQPTQDNIGNACQLWNAFSQIFTPDHSYTATGLSLMLSQYETTRKGPLIVKIEKMAANCWEAEIIWSKALYSTDLPLIDVNSILFLPLPDLEFEDSTPYRITVHTTPGWYEWVDDEWVENEAIASIRWRFKATTNPYPRGDMWYGCNYLAGSGSWTLQSNYDNWFCLQGETDPTIKHLDLEVMASTDDCDTYSTTIRLTRNYNQCDSDGNDMHAYIRFIDVPLPPGATILNAFISLCCQESAAAGSDLRILGIKEPDTLTFSTQADADGRAVTDAYKDWTAGNWSLLAWYGRFNDAQNIKAIIQEIIDQGTWASGNALAIKIYNTTQTRRRRMVSWDDAISDSPPRLHIEYRE